MGKNLSSLPGALSSGFSTPAEVIASLTPFQWKVFHLVVDGMLNREIARSLGVSLQLIKNTIGKIYDRTGMSRRAELSGWFYFHKEQIDEAHSLDVSGILLGLGC